VPGGARPHLALRKKLLFSLLAVVASLGLVTAILEALEDRGKIETWRLDDRHTQAEAGLRITRHDSYATIEDHRRIRATVAVPKPPGMLRFVVLGGSAAYGTPYGFDEQGNRRYGSVSDWLGAMLEARCGPSGVKTEVLNLAVGGAMSFVVLELLGDLDVLQPDAALVLTGNNDAGWVPSPLQQRIQTWILYRWIRGLVTDPVDASERPAFLPTNSQADHDDANFADNIEAMTRHAEAAPLDLVLVPLPINHRWSGRDNLICPPTYHSPESFLAPDPCIDPAQLLLAQGDAAGALEVLDGCGSSYSKVLLTGEAMLRQHSTEQARVLLDQLVESCPANRTKPSYNSTMRALASRESGTGRVHLADAAQRLALAGPHGIADPALFVDSNHMTWEGYFQVAQAIFDTLSRDGMLDSCGPRSTGTASPARLAADNGWQLQHPSEFLHQIADLGTCNDPEAGIQPRLRPPE
jgi:hypothetical protein